MNIPGSRKDEPSNAFMTAPQSTYIITVTTERLENLAKGKGLAADEATAILKWHNEEVAQAVQQAVQKARAEEADLYLRTLADRFNRLCEQVRKDPSLGNSSKGKKDNFLDGAETMLTEIQYQAERTRAELAAAQPRKDGDAGDEEFNQHYLGEDRGGEQFSND